ncbi:acyl carrier protein [Cognatishimia maritima]|uniref:[acyl-carrier-protein] S-malonyltransferase n=1 Tax=Cognatishimia maritima TaxID=870908 RepID=A0A1M5NUR4_9RHOB|nr:acyl carrier protein [Cognatishimia maritima]SHG93208.1 [acyl-carrier-protein] S-malonyltransferase [Cognatishimia maritima]
MKKTAVVIAPGRGTYNKSELVYLSKRHADKAALFSTFDDFRSNLGQTPISDLDAMARFQAEVHTRGDHASPLIYSCAYADFLSIDRDAYDIVAVTGNSMGWYIALACAGALTDMGGFEVVNTMGRLMQEQMIGGQVIYPYTDPNWVEVPGEKQRLLNLSAEISRRPEHFLALSIDLGGLLVLAGNEAGMAAFEGAVEPVQDRFPMRLRNHAGFHTNLQEPVAKMGLDALPQTLFRQPQLPLIDGRGAVWYPGASDLAALRDYTLGHQVVRPYDFATSIRMAAHEFAPDAFIVLGPGTTLSGSVAQSLIRCGWQGWCDKSSFQMAQAESATLITMGA